MADPTLDDFEDKDNRNEVIERAVTEGPAAFVEIGEMISANQESEAEVREKIQEAPPEQRDKLEKEAAWYENSWNWFREQLDRSREAYNRAEEAQKGVDDILRSGGTGTSPNEVYHNMRQWVTKERLTKEQIVQRYNEIAARERGSRSRDPALKALRDAYFNKPSVYKPNPKKQGGLRESELIDSKGDGELQDFYVKCRRYAQARSWKDLHADIGELFERIEVDEPRFVDLLRFKAYSNSLCARYRDGDPDGKELAFDPQPR